ncbi:MAG: glutamate synthase large subunit [Myxococcales bacterium]|nr:glutamate synthase large subunit [Myxococcales bacterium]
MMKDDPMQGRRALDAAARAGLYRPADERGSCGVALIAQTSGQPSHQIVAQGVSALERMVHRGAVGAHPLDGDGAGVLLQIPDALLRQVLRRGAHIADRAARRAGQAQVELPPVGGYAVAMCMMAADAKTQKAQRKSLAAAVKSNDCRIVAWRDVPVRKRHLGPVSAANAPHHAQAFITWDDAPDEAALHLRLLRIRRAATGGELYIASLSHRTIVYKGLVVPDRIPRYFVDLADVRCQSAFVIVHQRFSTNTAPAWQRAHPYRGLAHNGEINTRRGNRAWMQAREPLLDGVFPAPILEPNGSDSADLDNALELLLASGRSPTHAMRMLIPPAWENRVDLSPNLRGFFDWHAGLMEPWDGPACVIFNHGTKVGATLDRNGLRPARWQLTHDGVLILASEAGVLDLPTEQIARSERIGPGGILELDLATGELLQTDAIDDRLAAQDDWQAKAAANRTQLPNQAAATDSAKQRPLPELQRLQRGFGYSEEDVALLLAPMARTGKEPIGAMGDDTPLAVLSPRPQLLPHYFKQHFAQVTNPPIDPLRERVVMSLTTSLGPEANLWPGHEPTTRTQLTLDGPVLDIDQLAALRMVPNFKVVTLPLAMPLDLDHTPGEQLELALEGLCDRAEEAARNGAELLILSDEGVLSPSQALLPPVLATSAVHQHLIGEGLRQMCGLVVASGEVREVMHVAVLLGFGAGAVAPWLALETIAELAERQGATLGSVVEAQTNYLHALELGLRKVLSKMGIATLSGYRGARIFEAIGLDHAFTERWFPGTASQIGGIGAEGVSKEALARHEAAFTPPQRHSVSGGLDRGGRYSWHREGEQHAYGPSVIGLLQHAVRSGKREEFARYEARANRSERATLSLRGLLAPTAIGPAVPLDEVEPASAILRRFRTGAMSFGSLSKEAHETLAVAMNRVGGRSNSGEGGEDPARYVPAANGDSRRSAIKQVASGRFGVTPQYLLEADEIQIKMAQGAKPGEGGQLPGHKVDEFIAKTRHSTPGVTLISPPPHHDIYSIEDLAQLIADLRAANDRAIISVKLVSRAGVGTIAAGVVKAGADRVLISGTSGGTGASPLSSIKHAGLPWELGLSEAQQILMANGLRERVEVEIDGQLKTGRDVLLAAMMGAELFGFGTAALVASGCVLMRVCHKNICPVGIATQDPALRAHFPGTPAHIVRFMEWVAESVREQLAALGARSLDELIGRTDLLVEQAGAKVHDKAKSLDLQRLLWRPQGRTAKFSRTDAPSLSLQAAAFDRALWSEVQSALSHRRKAVVRREVSNVDRSVGTLISSRIVRQFGPQGLPTATLRLLLRGAIGQSFGAWLTHGLHMSLEGSANDGVAKGMAGGCVVVRSATYATYTEDPVLVGNAALYGATDGHLFVAGRAGERFAVRNSGATAVVEGVGDHGCEYMTGGEVLILGPTGRNLAAGMSGGMLWVVDERGDLADRINSDSVTLSRPDTAGWRQVIQLLQRHRRETHSDLAWRLLCDLDKVRDQVVQVTPHAYRAKWDALSDDAARRFAKGA